MGVAAECHSAVAGGSKAAEAAGAAAAEEGATIAESFGGDFVVSVPEERRNGAPQIPAEGSSCK